MRVSFLMFSCLVLSTLAIEPTANIFAVEPESIASTDWPAWRGPTHDGVAPSQLAPPSTWSSDKNIAWRVRIPGRGHGSPTVLGNRVYLPIAKNEQEVQSILCIDRKNGRSIWECKVHQGGFANQSKRPMNQKASLASSTIATDGELLYINFLNTDAVWTTAVSLAGDVVWQQRICKYVLHQGYGSSPTIHQNLVIVSADNKNGGVVAGLDKETGEFVWRHDRPAKPNYPSPVVVRAAGREQVILTGCDLVTSLDPLTGKLLWEMEGATTECVTSTVTDGTHVFSSGGYPKNHIAAYTADGSRKRIWENELRAYVPSLLHRDGYLFVVLDAGIAVCIRSDDGSVQWKKRLGGTFSSSPVLVGDRIYATSEDGVTHIFAADSAEFHSFGKNKLGTSVFATPAFSGRQIFMRVAEQSDDGRQEFLVCIGA